ncbi:MAG TPA: hypothetical protein VE971_05825 [Candidatus Eisenbacteria bacterium]|nr:hypothetical protein [Candidatus Eisenbacteria bacterium]
MIDDLFKVANEACGKIIGECTSEELKQYVRIENDKYVNNIQNILSLAKLIDESL